MKQSLKRFALFLAVITGLIGCSKTGKYTSVNGAPASPLIISLSASSVQKGQILVASLPAQATSSQVRWTISPSSGAYISSFKEKAMILFANPGPYRVTATYASDSVSQPSDSSTAPVIVIDSVYKQPQAPPAESDTFSIVDDQINITPMLDSAGELVLVARSSKLYECFPTYVVSPFFINPGSINIGFTEVISTLPAGLSCNGAQYPAVAYFFVRDWVYGIGEQTYPADGVYPISIGVWGRFFEGSLIIDHGTYNFSWIYNSGVVISPLQVKKQ
jgi:hypothetical protein